MEMIYKKTIRVFENAGTVNPSKAYYVELENVVNTDNQDIRTMIDNSRYFSIFAPWQSGKTTYLEGIRSQLHNDSTYVIIILSFQRYRDLDKVQFYSLIEKDLYFQLIDRLRTVRCEKAENVKQFLDSHRLTDHISFSTLFEELNRILQFKKIVIFIDEFDGIATVELENFLNSLRYLYQKYKLIERKALYSVGLIGIRNVTKLVVGGVSPFNIADHVNLPPFSLKNVRDLYAQYTEETNQPFTEGAVKRVYEETAGQPWLVNRLGTILTINVKPETVDPIDEKDVDKAIQILLKEENLHFDNLFEKVNLYKETFIEIAFDHVSYHPYHEEQNWLEQYGLIKNKENHAVVANNIYKNIFVEHFFKEVNANKSIPPQRYELTGNRLDMERIIKDFGKYVAQIGVRAFYEHDKPYEKTGQFLLTAWLYQFVRDGESELRYEISTGLGRMDILLYYKGFKYIIETKVNRFEDIGDILDDGIFQLSNQYLNTEDIENGYLVIFDVHSMVGFMSKPVIHIKDSKNITSFIIGIGRPVQGK